jgi:hypothetical protein
MDMCMLIVFRILVRSVRTIPELLLVVRNIRTVTDYDVGNGSVVD